MNKSPRIYSIISRNIYHLREVPLQDAAYRMSNSLNMAMNWVIKRDTKREETENSNPVFKVVCLQININWKVSGV